jgi:hypothetical protein
MVMDSDERRTMNDLLSRFQESDTPQPGHIAVFYDDKDTMLYAGIIEEWPMIISADIEWGEMQRKDASKEPFAGRTVKFLSALPGN